MIALVFAAACKKDAAPAPTPAPGAMAGSAANPHAGMEAMQPMEGSAANPHAGMDSHASVPKTTEPKTLESLADGRLGMGPFSFVAPKGWTAKPVTSDMRTANFTLPGKPGEGAELVVYYFGDHGAGSVDDNLDRWLGQFEQADGKKSRDVAKIEKTKFAGQDATYVSVAGHFQAQAMGSIGPSDVKDGALLAAIIDSPSGPYYFKLVGAKPTVDAQAAAFRAMLESLKLR